MSKKPELAKDLPFLATRVQREIHDWVEEEAARNKRSKSAQLAWLLERLWESRSGSTPPPAAPSRKPRTASALAIAALGTVLTFGAGGDARAVERAVSNVSDFSSPGLHILSTWRRRRLVAA